MNYGISILFRAIPLLMALFCFGYGAFVLDMGTDVNRFVAGPVVFSLGMICIALFATAATIIRQLIHTYSTAAKYVLPILGYLAAIVCFIGGMTYINDGITAAHFVAGHVICGVAFSYHCHCIHPFHSNPAKLKTNGSYRTGKSFLICTGRCTDYSCSHLCCNYMGMDFLAIRTKQHSYCLFRSRTCYGRISLHMHQLSGTCSYHITPDTEHLCRFRTEMVACPCIGNGYT